MQKSALLLHTKFPTKIPVHLPVKYIFCINLPLIPQALMTAFIFRTYAAPSDFIIFKMVIHHLPVNTKIIKKLQTLHKALPSSVGI